MRLFIGTELQSEEFSRLQKLFDFPGLKLVKHFHLTWKFIGEVPEKYVPQIIGALQEINMKPFSVSSTHLGCFPNEQRINVVWAGLEGQGLQILKRAIDEHLLPFFPKDEGFAAHITLARVKFTKEKEVLLRSLKEAVKTENFAINSFTLYKSELQPDGPVYEPLSTFQLK